MKRSSKTKQIFLGALVLTIAALTLYVMLFLNIEEKNNNISTLVNEVEIILQKEIKLRSVKHLINDTQDDRAKLDSHFVADDEIVNFIETIENVGTDSGAEVEVASVSVSDINTEAVGKKVMISELLNLDFKVEGSFAQIFHFLSMLEKLPFKIDISLMNFEKILDENEDLESWSGFFNVTAIKLK